jgi:hypothetical protein
VGGGVIRALLYLALCVAALWKRPSWVLAVWVAVPIVLVFVISQVKPLWHDYYFLVCLPPILVLAAAGMTRFPKRAVAAIAAVIVAVTLYRDVRGVQYHGEDWRGAVADILVGSQPGDAILFYAPYTRRSFEFYRIGPVGDILLPAYWSPATAPADMRTDLDESLFQQIPSHPRVWFLNAYSDTTQRRLVVDRLQSWLAAQYPFHHSQHFRGPITVTVYGRDRLTVPPTITAHYPFSRMCP